MDSVRALNQELPQGMDGLVWKYAPRDRNEIPFRRQLMMGVRRWSMPVVASAASVWILVAVGEMHFAAWYVDDMTRNGKLAAPLNPAMAKRPGLVWHQPYPDGRYWVDYLWPVNGNPTHIQLSEEMDDVWTQTQLNTWYDVQRKPKPRN